ncbi:hypothetical protein [uncultured Corynebacterium sp.]|uniref:hypothetical protein n=1 Tax=uncultured Corynebacterium sp. TaxID=159447 RepID=UPI00259BA42F|nr:hypothetical protein [uncultured Corynebacterium sp.]
MGDNKDSMAQLGAGVRAYVYRVNNQERVALHLRQGTEVIDLSVEQMQRFAHRLGELVNEFPS